MSIFAMIRFWVALLLPLLIDWFFWVGAIRLWWLWLPISVPLLIWAFFSYRREKKEEAAMANMLNSQKMETVPLKKEFIT
ncbi:hypothetical protein BIY29_18695 [Brenneria alni]|uniref:Uncharacterized protein n=1 Tax=Brenneria alni TaxID=71656 RepID=A0A421DJ17_9GAMM|nr:hypothetical protein [Brenneria alni]RLM18074.1 hypothetical protein BIY29_18695 [Brenneria alni]